MNASKGKVRAVGAYYTPDDITGYIARATLLPWILDAAAQACPAAFAPDGAAWRLLAADPDRYLSAVLRHGVDETPAALPLESLTEYQGRRRRYQELRDHLRGGAVHASNDLVTLNLDVRQFLHDLVAHGRDRDVADAVSQAAARIMVLDPTCGDGAFLRAALQVLEDVQWMCRQRLAAPAVSAGCHRFHIRQAILQRNLFGVDLVAGAVDECRTNLRRALIDGLEAGDCGAVLPDLTASLRVGNALRGRVQPEAETKRPVPFDWRGAFPDVLRAGGFDVILGNPPYVAAARAGYRVTDYVTAGCPDVYAWVLERSAQLLRPGGRTGMIVPLSLTFSRDFDACRRLLFDAYQVNWFASFGRIPSALFAFDIRVRNTIHLGQKASTPHSKRCYATRLHRWFDEARPRLFALLHYAAVQPAVWRGRVPKIGSDALGRALEQRLEHTSARLGDSLSRPPTPHVLYAKKTAYNWLTFSRRLPPSFDADGSPTAQTQVDTLYFPEARQRDAALLLLNGKWAFVFWSAVGDDFHVARWMIADFPIDLARLPEETWQPLAPLLPRLEAAMQRATAYKRNAGKRVGSFNLARCRRITDQSDRVFARLLGLEDVWEEVEALYAHIVKTTFDHAPTGAKR